VSNWKELERKYFMQTGVRVPVTLVKGQGVKIWDDEGREYLDFVGGWACASLGHCHPVVAEAVAEQAKTLIQTSNYFYTVPQLQLAELLVQNSCLGKVYVCNSGTEANEGAVKLARRYGATKLNGAYEVITAMNSFHGRTLAMTAATGQNKFQQPYLPLPLGFVNVEYNSVEAIKAATTNQTCAVMLEPIEAEGGVNIPDDKYLAEVRAWCDQKGILLILDEVQTGLGRTGTLFAYEQYGVEPDIMTLAKGLGGGVPIGAFMAKDEVCVFAPGEKKKYNFITDVRGRGLLVAVEFSQDIAQEVLMACLDGGLLVNRLKPNALRFIPPLILSKEEVDEAIGILDKALGSIAST